MGATRTTPQKCMFVCFDTLGTLSATKRLKSAWAYVDLCKGFKNMPNYGYFEIILQLYFEILNTPALHKYHH